jgi:hypothetical protein
MWARKALAFEELFYFVSEKPQLQNSECRFRSKSEENIRLKIVSRLFSAALRYFRRFELYFNIQKHVFFA